MGYLKQTSESIDVLPLPSDPKFSVRMRRVATGRDHHESMQAAIGDGGNQRVMYSRYLRYLAADLIVSWNLTDANDEVLEISPQTLAAIEDEKDYDFLLTEAQRRVKLRSEEDEAPLGTPSDSTSPDTNSNQDTSPTGSETSS